ncbi:MAG: hypothetical protein ACK5LO_02385 [Leucobacter sp.]
MTIETALVFGRTIFRAVRGEIGLVELALLLSISRTPNAAAVKKAEVIDCLDFEGQHPDAQGASSEPVFRGREPSSGGLTQDRTHQQGTSGS